MKSKLILSVALLACVAVIVYAAPSPKSLSDKITGDYVEARTASVFCGACHYNAEFMTLGQNAVMAWAFTGGSYDGVDISGVRAIAAVASPANLSLNVEHRTELVIDSSATDKQAAAVEKLLKAKCGEQLGQIALVRRAPISFSYHSDGYLVDARGVASLDVKFLPDDSCCTMAGDVWYSPLSAVQHRKVGYTELATYSGKVGDVWQRTSENSAFYGAIDF